MYLSTHNNDDSLLLLLDDAVLDVFNEAAGFRSLSWLSLDAILLAYGLLAGWLFLLFGVVEVRVAYGLVKGTAVELVLDLRAYGFWTDTLVGATGGIDDAVGAAFTVEFVLDAAVAADDDCCC